MTTIAAQLEQAGVALDAELPIRVRWSVSCGAEGCRFALLHLPTLDVARRRAVEHLDVHAEHRVELSADASLPVEARAPEPPQDGRSLPDVAGAYSQRAGRHPRRCPPLRGGPMTTRLHPTENGWTPPGAGFITLPGRSARPAPRLPLTLPMKG